MEEANNAFGIVSGDKRKSTKSNMRSDATATAYE